MVKENNKRVMITFCPEDLERLENLCSSFHLSKTQVIHYFLTGELEYNYLSDSFNLELYYEQKV